MTFNVGEIWTDAGAGGVYTFSDLVGVIVSWSGCTPSSQVHLCIYDGYTPPYQRTVSVTVTIDGRYKTFSITANDQREDTSGGGDLN